MIITEIFNLTRDHKNTPATTIVEECSNELTGVGPSIAIGNQYPETVSADFPRIEIINIQLLTPITNSIIPISPIRLYKTAHKLADWDSLRLVYPINNIDINPTLSHPNMNNFPHLINTNIIKIRKKIIIL